MSPYSILVFILIVVLFVYMVYMPGDSYRGKLPPLDDADHELADRLESHVAVLCRNPAGRNFIEKHGLKFTEEYIAQQFHASGYEVRFQEYQMRGDTYANVEVELTGTSKPDEIIIVGAHYDAVAGAPGANDNGSGVAAILELANLFRNKNLSRTIRFVGFVNEEPPLFMTSDMGSYVYAKRSAEKGEKIIGMFSLETIGYYRDEAGSQHYPPPFKFFYPNKGNFIAFVGNLSSRSLVSRSLRLFRKHATFPSEGITTPSFITGVNWSDHWSFWEHGYPAIMITDTALYRYPYYHTVGDTPDKVNYEKMVYVVKGLQKMFEELLITD